MISAADFSFISIGREVRVASSGRSSICESTLDGEETVNTTRGGGENRRVVDSQDRLVVVLLGVKQGLDHSKGEFGVFGTIDCILHLFFRRIEYGILDHGTAEQSTMQNSQNKLQMK